MTERRKRLIEVAFPLEEVSEHSRHEKNVRHSHISTLHIWWARRPLAACRAFIYASLVDDPGNDRERAELVREVADLASWKAIREPKKIVRTKEQGGSGLTGEELVQLARKRILDCNGGKPPRVLDPFAGGGAIPLEALRLGCDVEASDLNPVAVLILKGTVEYPQKYGQPTDHVPAYIRDVQEQEKSAQTSFFDGDVVEAYKANPIATEVRYWGHWMLERAREELAEFYPPEDDGRWPVAYLWSRTTVCPNCGAEMPLLRQYWLAKRKNKKVALSPVVDKQDISFKVVEGPDVSGDPGQATTSRGDTQCLACNQVVKSSFIQDAGNRGQLGARMTAVVLQSSGKGGKRYRSALPGDAIPFEAAEERLRGLPAVGSLVNVPDEPLVDDPRNIWCFKYGLTTFGSLFGSRQLLALTTFSQLVRRAYDEMLTLGMENDRAEAVATYLALAVDRLADYNSTLARWGNDDEGITDTFARQALPMVWDFGEANPIGDAGGSWLSLLTGQLAAIYPAISASIPKIRLRAADVAPETTANLALTDPPYYDAINYANLSDYFYVWLKRSVGWLHEDLFNLPLTPKRDQTVMDVYAVQASGDDDRTTAARRHYVTGMQGAFAAMAAALEVDGTVGIVFAHTDTDAWATLLEGLLATGLVPDASWPLDTEQGNKIAGQGQARLRTSVWMACSRRSHREEDAFLADVIASMRPVIRERLLHYWSQGIRGADFFISAIGPALSVFGKHRKVMRPDGNEVTVRDFLDLVRRESTHIALEQVLHGADLGLVDATTQEFVTWVWSYSRAPLDAGEAIALCLATGADYGEVVRPHAIAVEAKEKSKKLVKLRTIKERGENDEDLGLNQPARPAPLIDQLQRAAWLWSRNRTDELASYRAALGEAKWQALRTLGQAVAECLPEGDDDRRLINGLLSSSVMGTTPPKAAPASLDAPGSTSRRPKPAPASAMLPGLEEGAADGD